VVTIPLAPQLLGCLRVQADPEHGPDDVRVGGQRVELDDRQLRVGHVQFPALCQVAQRGGDGRGEPLRVCRSHLRVSSGNRRATPSPRGHCSASGNPEARRAGVR